MAPSISDPARKAIEELSVEDEEVSNASLSDLSNLNRDELELFIREWSGLDDERRIHVIHRLFEMAEDNIEFNFDAIFRYCFKDPIEDIRSLAIEGLWENEESSLIDPLITILEEDESVIVQATAATALARFAEMAEFKKLRPEQSDKVIEALLGAVDDREKDINVRRRVLESVAVISMPDVTDAIRDAFNSNIHELMISAIYAMGKSCDLTWIPLLLHELDNEEAEIRFEVAGALGELEDEESVPYLINLINDDDIDVILAAIQALGKIATDSARECLIICLENENDAIREAAEEAIQGLNGNDDPLSFRV